MDRSFGMIVRLSLALFLCIGLGCQLPEEEQKEPGPPHMVIFLSDDHGYEFSGCYGSPDVLTPNIDALAKEGMKFTHVFAASPTCSPSRSVLFTGLYPNRNGAMGNHAGIKPGVKALPGYLKELGYRVVLANKKHIKPFEQFGFEYLAATLPEDENNPRKYRQEGLDVDLVDEFLQQHAKENPSQPLCLILAENNPHVTWEQNKTYIPDLLTVPPYMVDTKMTRIALSNYFQDITTMDRKIKEVRNSLEAHGYADNTLFIYTSDQGAEWPHSKWTVYDTGIRVPFLAVWPNKIKAGIENTSMISFTDLLPTLVDLAGGDPPQEIDGLSFKDVLLENRKSFRNRVYASHTGDGTMNQFPQRGVRTMKHKYVLNLNPENKWTTHFTLVPDIHESHLEVYKTWAEKAENDEEAARLLDIIENHPAEELYDLANDPYELNNLAYQSGMEGTVKAFRKYLRNWMEFTGEGD